MLSVNVRHQFYDLFPSQKVFGAQADKLGVRAQKFGDQTLWSLRSVGGEGNIKVSVAL